MMDSDEMICEKLSTTGGREVCSGERSVKHDHNAQRQTTEISAGVLSPTSRWVQNHRTPSEPSDFSRTPETHRTPLENPLSLKCAVHTTNSYHAAKKRLGSPVLNKGLFQDSIIGTTFLSAHFTYLTKPHMKLSLDNQLLIRQRRDYCTQNDRII